jgi:peptide/nickel transport system substrate-binding protein
MRVIEWVSGSHDIVERTGEYWMDGEDGEPLTYFERQRSEFTAEDSVRALALRSGDVDLANSIAPRDVESIQNADGVEAVENVFQTTMAQFTFSTEYGPFHDNQDLRIAVAYAIDRQALADVLGEGLGEPARWFLSPGHIGYEETEESVPYYEYDPDMARQYLESAGYPDGLDTEVSVINRELDVQQAEMLEQMLGEVGIRICQVDLAIAHGVEHLLPLPHHAEHAVVADRDDNRELVLVDGR